MSWKSGERQGSLIGKELRWTVGFPLAQGFKEPTCSAEDARDTGSIPGSGRSPGEGNGNPLQYCCLENPVDRGLWRATVGHDRVTGQGGLPSRYVRMLALLCDPDFSLAVHR